MWEESQEIHTPKAFTRGCPFSYVFVRFCTQFFRNLYVFLRVGNVFVRPRKRFGFRLRPKNAHFCPILSVILAQFSFTLWFFSACGRLSYKRGSQGHGHGPTCSAVCLSVCLSVVLTPQKTAKKTYYLDDYSVLHFNFEQCALMIDVINKGLSKNSQYIHIILLVCLSV